VGPVSLPPASGGSSARHVCRPLEMVTWVPVVSSAVIFAMGALSSEVYSTVSRNPTIAAAACSA
jgi:hypothetical protein